MVSHKQHFFFVVRTYEIRFLSCFAVYHTVSETLCTYEKEGSPAILLTTLEGIILSEISQTEREKCCIISLICAFEGTSLYPFSSCSFLPRMCTETKRHQTVMGLEGLFVAVYHSPGGPAEKPWNHQSALFEE